MSTVASLLQAVLACPSARRMLLSSRPVDDRVSHGLSGYSSGRSPADIRYREDDQYHGLEQSVRGDFETMWRAQILAAFCLLTDNAVCDIGDMSVDVPQDTLRKASRSDTLVEVALCEFAKQPCVGPANQLTLLHLPPAYYTHLTGAVFNAQRFVEDLRFNEPLANDSSAAPIPFEDLKR